MTSRVWYNSQRVFWRPAMTITLGAQSRRWTCSLASRDREWELEWSELTIKGVLLSHQPLECHRSIEKMTHHRERCNVMEQPFGNLKKETYLCILMNQKEDNLNQIFPSINFFLMTYFLWHLKYLQGTLHSYDASGHYPDLLNIPNRDLQTSPTTTTTTSTTFSHQVLIIV